MKRAELLASLMEAMVEVSFERIAISDISQDSKIIEELKFDSLDFAELMLHCETVTNQKIDESSVIWREVQTVNDLIGLFHLDEN